LPEIHGAPCFPGLPPYFPIGRRISTAESSARICADATTRVLPIHSACRAGPSCRFSRLGHRRARRATSSRAANRSVFTRFEARRIRHAGIRQVLRLDVWLVSAHRHPYERSLLLRDLFLFRLRGRPSPPLQVIRALVAGPGWNSHSGRNACREKQD